MPTLDAEQRRIVRLIKREGRNISDPRTRRRYLIAAVETGLVESGLRNLPGGDADSQGWRQERASLYSNPRNLRASIRRFRQEFEQHYDPGETAGEVAAQVQRPREDLRYKYGTRRDEALQILGQVRGGGGMPGSGPQYRQIPGVDNSELRQQLLVNYLAERGQPGALANLGRGLQQVQDVPGRRIQTRGSRPGRPGRGTPGDRPVGELKELIWRGQNPQTVKDGKRVDKDFYSAHKDHVHAAGRQRAMVQLGRIAQEMGLSVRENPAFDPVDPVHTSGSYHYGRRVGKRRFRAIDVSGDPAKMAAFAQRVAELYGV